MVLVAAIAWMWADEKLGADFCPAKTEKHILVLHDGTTRLHEHALQSVTYQIDRIKNALQPENRLTLLTLTSPARGLVSEEFSRCKPKPQDQIKVLTENPAALHKMNAEFEDAYTEGMERVLQEESANESHISAALFAVVTKYEDVTQLYILSDLLQHSEALSMITNTGSCTAFKQSLHVTGIAGRLRGASVNIVQYSARRYEKRQKQWQGCWEEVFELSGAASVTWAKLEAL